MNESFRRITEENLKEQFKQLPWEQKLLEYFIIAFPPVVGTILAVMILCAILSFDTILLDRLAEFIDFGGLVDLLEYLKGGGHYGTQ